MKISFVNFFPIICISVYSIYENYKLVSKEDDTTTVTVEESLLHRVLPERSSMDVRYDEVSDVSGFHDHLNLNLNIPSI